MEMDIYWISEYVKILIGYIFLMFIWPSVVFRSYLKGRTKIFRFSFCVTAQIVIINTTVLMLGLLHILNTKLVAAILYGLFFISILQEQDMRNLLTGKREIKLYQLSDIKRKIIRQIHKLGHDIYTRMGEYILLTGVIIFGVIFFSYGAFQVHSYGVYDVFFHHGWVNSLVNGIIFPDGVYPEAMHCFIYCLNALFGIRTYSLMMFLQCIHITIFFLSAYIFLREVFYWRYSPIFVLGLYMVLDITKAHSMYRLPLTLPMEFGLHAQFLCAAYLIRYIKNTNHVIKGNKVLKYCWDENLLLFMMALATSIASHYYVTIMAFIICAVIGLCNIKRIFRKEYFISLTVSVVLGCMIASAPMIGGRISGIPFEGSIIWALDTMNSENDNKEGQENISDNPSIVQGPLTLTSEDLEVIGRLPLAGQKLMQVIIKTEYFIKAMYQNGYQRMYEPEKRGRKIFWITVLILLFCIINRRKNFKYIGKITNGYFPVVLISIITVFLCANCSKPNWGVPVIIPEHRFCPESFLMTFAVMMMPADILFSVASQFFRDTILKIASYVFLTGVYVYINLTGKFHGYMFYSLNRYDSAVYVTNSIIEEFPKDSYTIVSPMEESQQIFPFGSHEEISTFLEKICDEYYTLPTKYVFIYVEKKPLVYHQTYFFSGPAWLGISGNSRIKATEISEDAAKEDLTEHMDYMWGPYDEGRTIMESKVYEWCQNFSKAYPSTMNIYYEDEDFICYYFEQNNHNLFNLAQK